MDGASRVSPRICASGNGNTLRRDESNTNANAVRRVPVHAVALNAQATSHTVVSASTRIVASTAKRTQTMHNVSETLLASVWLRNGLPTQRQHEHMTASTASET